MYYNIQAPPVPRSPMTGGVPVAIVGYQGPYPVIGAEPSLKDDPKAWAKANWQYLAGGGLLVAGLAMFALKRR